MLILINLFKLLKPKKWLKNGIYIYPCCCCVCPWFWQGWKPEPSCIGTESVAIWGCTEIRNGHIASAKSQMFFEHGSHSPCHRYGQAEKWKKERLWHQRAWNCVMTLSHAIFNEQKKLCAKKLMNDEAFFQEQQVVEANLLKQLFLLWALRKCCGKLPP